MVVVGILRSWHLKLGVTRWGDDGVWISANVKHWFSTGWFGDTEEELKGVLKCWGYGNWDLLSFWSWFGGWKCNSSHGVNIICWGCCCNEGVAAINSNCYPGSAETCNGCWLLSSCFFGSVVKNLPKIFLRNILFGNLITSN